ncbi:MAG TPA: toxin-antitoxin system YwqK family antitoxin [Bacteroidales bacterium]|nr:toxin-antitoxin system YwqK family antitoxin [Bacteroidales bacterium]HNS46879.1 toxin-antitoxin system YwqK family antitoxin [Bacteroidales bacterium]
MSSIKQLMFAGVISLLLLVTGCQRTVTTYWENGLKKSELSFRGKTFEGISTWWHSNGNKQMEASYHNNLLDGKSTRWFYNGNVESITFYSGGLKNGPAITFSESGEKVSEENYRNDSLEGPYTTWFPGVGIRITGFFDHGLYDSTWTYFNEQGRRIGEGRFEKGTGTQVGFYPSGKVMREIPYVENKKHGEERWYGEQGNLERVLVFENDRLISERSGE